MTITMSCTCSVDAFFFFQIFNKDLNCPMKVPIFTFSGFSIKQIMAFSKKFKKFYF